MKKKNYLYLALLLSFGMASCEKDVIERPDPFAKLEQIAVSLNFSYRESFSTSGFVRFNNLSTGFRSFKWDFGYKDATGKPVISADTNPYTFFPANGEYLIVLMGIDVYGKEQTIHKYILILNKEG